MSVKRKASKRIRRRKPEKPPAPHPPGIRELERLMQAWVGPQMTLYGSTVSYRVEVSNARLANGVYISVEQLKQRLQARIASFSSLDWKSATYNAIEIAEAMARGE